MKLEEDLLQEWIATILDSKKYRQAGLNPATVADLIRQEAPKHETSKPLLKIVKRKLHNIVAPYLGIPNYADLIAQLDQVDPTTLESPSLRSFCQTVLAQHASTAERLPLMPDFYTQLFKATGNPHTIIDLACGLNPLAFPWMGLPTTVRYHAYDILQPRVDFINRFFTKIGLAPLAENRDILVSPPAQPADLAFFFKEAHRFEKRQPGCNRAFWQSLDVNILAVSLPTQNLSGSYSLLERHHQLVHANLPESSIVRTITFSNEILFLIQTDGKSNHG